MRERRLQKENIWTPEARATVIGGFALRLVMLLLIIYVAKEAWDWDTF